MTQAVIIYGGNSKQSRLIAIHQKVENLLTKQKVQHQSIFVHELPAEDLITANFSSKAILTANEQVEKADFVIVLTPIYKASYTGILKTYLDLLPQKALEGKTIIPIAIGGSIGHLLALEYALNPILSVLGASTIQHPVFIIDKQIDRLKNDEFLINPEANERLENAFHEIVSNGKKVSA